MTITIEWSDLTPEKQEEINNKTGNAGEDSFPITIDVEC